MPDDGSQPWPASQVEIWPITALLAYPRNPRTHSPEQVAQLAASMREFGWTVPVLVDEVGVLIAGHGRIMAANTLGLDRVPVMIARGWSEEQKRAYRIADNQLPLQADWDYDLLKFELTDLARADFDMDVMGFPEVELTEFLSGLGDPPPPAAPTPDDVRASLAERFGVPPFTVLNARAGWWQDRKRAWIALGIQSEVGRGEDSSTYGTGAAADLPARAIDMVRK